MILRGSKIEEIVSVEIRRKRRVGWGKEPGGLTATVRWRRSRLRGDGKRVQLHGPTAWGGDEGG